MDSIERAHIDQLLQIHRTNLRQLELQAAQWGALSLPIYIARQLDEQRDKIADLEERLMESMPHHNLPPRDYDRFVGRQKELDEVRRLLLPYPKSRHHLVTIDGIGGIGKSALALETAYTFRDRYAAMTEAGRFEAIVWVSAKRSYLTADGILQRSQAFRTLDDLYTAIAQVLDYPAITRAEEQRAIVEQVLSEQRTLLILDNLETVDDEELLVFLRLLPDPTKAIVTTRHRIDVAYPVRLLGMGHADALTLIAHESARKDVALTSDESEELWHRTGGVPLAIVWSIGLMGLGGSVESVLRRLSQGQSDIARFCFEESVAQIRGRDAHKLLLALSLFGSSVSRKMLGEIAGLDEDEFGRDGGLAELLRLSLVNKEGERFTLLPLTRSFVEDELAQQPTIEQKLREEWLLKLTNQANPYADWSWRWRDIDWLKQEGHHFITATDWSRQSSRPDILLQILPAVLSFYDITGHWSEALKIGQIGLEFARLVGDLKTVLYVLNFESWILGQQGLYSEAESAIIEAVSISQKMDDVEWQNDTLQTLSQVLRRQKNFDQAIEVCRQGLLLLSSLPESQQIYARANIEFELGKIARDRAEWHNAQKYFIAARSVFQDDDAHPVFDLERAWGLLGNLGMVDHILGELDSAGEKYRKALEFVSEHGSVANKATWLIRLATLEEQRGNHILALEYAREGLELSQRLGMIQELEDSKALLARIATSAAQ